MDEYIDREVFKKSVEEHYCKPCKAEGKDHNGCWCRACWVDDMLDEVIDAPPADVAPVVHGRKIEDGDIGCFSCALCAANVCRMVRITARTAARRWMRRRTKNEDIQAFYGAD